jgi:hypothetical protein
LRDIQNRLKHRFGFLQYLIVPESQDKQTRPFECARPSAVDLIAVLRTVELDDQTDFIAIKIRNVRPNVVLTSELEATQATRAQAVPQSLRLAPVLVVRSTLAVVRVRVGKGGL